MFASPPTLPITPHLPAHPTSCSLSVLKSSPCLFPSTPLITAIATLVKALLRKPFQKYQSGGIHSYTEITQHIGGSYSSIGKSSHTEEGQFMTE